MIISRPIGHIQRKTMLYETGVEYGDYTMNHVQGCAHGCTYPCYAYMMKKRFGVIKDYDEWLKPYLVDNTLELLDKEIPKYKDKIESVQLCFTTDPFMVGYDEIAEMSLAAIKKLNSNDIKCSILTKGVLPKELSAFSRCNEYGITLITLNEDFRVKVEPFAASIRDRISALRYLHDQGCYTWVSMEPYPTPNLIEQDICEILREISFVDKIIFGRTNYSKAVSNFKEHKSFYNECAKIVIDYCDRNGIDYHIKKGTVSR